MANTIGCMFLCLLFTKFAFFHIVVSTEDNKLRGLCKSRVEIYGYSCEEHRVTTQDGYIVSIQRIPTGRSGGAAVTERPPVLLQHGLFMDGTTWVLNSPDESLGFILADNGYDVWIANTRGTIYSRSHVSLSSDEPVYWDWSWDELVAYELPAIVEYVYKQSGNQKIQYVGHSQGTLIALASFSQHNLLNMVKSAALLSPIAFLNHVPSPIAQAVAKLFLSEDVYWLGITEFDTNSKPVHDLITTICENPGIDCSSLIPPLTGKNCCLNFTAFNLFLEDGVQPTATKNLIHYSQMIQRGTIMKYDYNNVAVNMKQYGQFDPQAYNIFNIPNEFPLFLSYGGRDALSDPKDVQHLLQVLHFHRYDRLAVQYVNNYAHLDFVIGANAKQIVYDPLIAFLKLQ